MTEKPDVVYGRLLESAHISGYGFERAMRELDLLLKADDWREVGPGFSDVNAFLRSIDLAAFNIKDKAKLHNRIKELQPEASTRAIGKATGTAETTVRRHVKRGGAPNGAPSHDVGPADQGERNGGAPNGAPEPSGALQRSSSEVVKLADRAARKDAAGSAKQQRSTDLAARAADAARRLAGDVDAAEPEHGQWWSIGRHLLYCGDSTDPEFIDATTGAAFAFADPPYNTGKADWDSGFTWAHDYLAESANIVAVTPGISAIADFYDGTACGVLASSTRSAVTGNPPAAGRSRRPPTTTTRSSRAAAAGPATVRCARRCGSPRPSPPR